jgi:hypothetical protein
LADDGLRSVVVALAEVVMACLTVRVEHVERWPVVVVETAPDRVVSVKGDGVADAEVTGGCLDVLRASLELELGRVHADRDEAVVGVLL